LYTVRTPLRDALAAHLTKLGIGNGVYYPLPLHRQPCFRDLRISGRGLESCELTSKTVLSLPMYAELSAAQRNAVIRAVRGFFA
jgi:dTDP-4-amino-4,6-dideoxygalactose transaminase